VFFHGNLLEDLFSGTFSEQRKSGALKRDSHDYRGISVFQLQTLEKFISRKDAKTPMNSKKPFLERCRWRQTWQPPGGGGFGRLPPGIGMDFIE